MKHVYSASCSSFAQPVLSVAVLLPAQTLKLRVRKALILDHVSQIPFVQSKHYMYRSSFLQKNFIQPRVQALGGFGSKS